VKNLTKWDTLRKILIYLGFHNVHQCIIWICYTDCGAATRAGECECMVVGSSIGNICYRVIVGISIGNICYRVIVGSAVTSSSSRVCVVSSLITSRVAVVSTIVINCQWVGVASTRVRSSEGMGVWVRRVISVTPPDRTAYGGGAVSKISIEISRWGVGVADLISTS
jgi:hypothetical protein